MLRVAPRRLHVLTPPLLTRTRRSLASSALLPPAVEPEHHPTAQSAAAAGSMNVTRHNFEENFADLKRDIELPSCRFVAIDTEFTGLSPDERQKERFLGAAVCTARRIG